MNVIQTENALTGTTAWQLTNAALNREIEGYCSATSVPVGGSIDFHVSSSSGYTLDVYRMGYYAGAGARLMTGGIAKASPGVQPMPGGAALSDPGTALECAWAVSHTLTIPSDWVSGIYVAKLMRTTDGLQCYLIFCVRDDTRAAEVAYIQPTTTYLAYNKWGGKSTYSGANWGVETVGGSDPRYGLTWNYAEPAALVSYHRPYDHWHADAQAAGLGAGHFFAYNSSDDKLAGNGRGAWEYELVLWLEQQGYDVAYVTSEDVTTGCPTLTTASVVLSTGHDEYYTHAAKDRLTALRDGGTSLCFLGANPVYWAIEYVGGTTSSVMRCWKQNGTSTNQFRLLTPPEPEEALIGVQYYDWPVNVSWHVKNAGHWAYAGSGLTEDQLLAGLVGYESDARSDTRGFTDGAAPPGTRTNLASSTSANHEATIYQHPTSLAWVFASGSCQFSWALASSPATVPAIRANLEQPGLKTMFANILTAMGATPGGGASGGGGAAVVEYQLEYSLNGGSSWTVLQAWATDRSEALNTVLLPDGALLLRAKARDSSDLASTTGPSVSVTIDNVGAPPPSGDPFVVIAGLTIPIAEGQAVSRIERGGASYRAYAGNLRGQYPWEKGGWQFTTGLLTNAEAAALSAAVAFGAQVACTGLAFGRTVTAEVTLGDGAYINTGTDDGTGVLRSFAVTVREV